MTNHKHLRPDIKKWLKVHSVAFGVTATLIVVLSGVLSLYFIGNRFSPTGLSGGGGATIKLQVSDHNTNPTPGLLPNSLLDGTPADYVANHFMNLPKVNGDIPTLFRMQGTLAYNSLNTTDKATVIISLPPRLLLTPSRLSFGRSTYTFTGPNNNLGVSRDPGSSGTESVAIDKVVDADNDTRGESYKITISNIDRKRFAFNPFEQTRELYASLNPFLETAQAYSPPPAGNILVLRRPYQFRLTFKEPVTSASVDTLVSYIAERGEKDNIFFGNTSCGGSANDRAYVCAKTITQAFSPTTPIVTLPLHQKIELSGVYLAGNVAALVEIQNLKLFPSSIAVGGQLTNVTGTKLTNYLQNNPGSLLKWSNTVDDQITELYNRRGQGTLAQPLDTTAVWKLNSPSDDPDDSAAATTFSAPPEGKLWTTAGSLTFANDVTFNGSGTIVVNGSLTFNGQVSCTGDKRLAFIVRGNITFNGTPNVACGAYVALGSANGAAVGSLRFNGEPPTGGATARGIFVAKNDLQIPNAATAPQMIDYDSDFASNPTVLFREFMNLIYSSSS